MGYEDAVRALGFIESFTTPDTKYPTMSKLMHIPMQLGLNQTQARGLFRDAGWSFRDSTFNDIFQQRAESVLQGDRVKFVGRSREITEGVLGIADQPLPEKYRLVFKYDYYDPDKDKWFRNEEVNVETPYLGVRSDLESQAADQIGSLYPVKGQIIQNVSVIRGYVDLSQ